MKDDAKKTEKRAEIWERDCGKYFSGGSVIVCYDIYNNISYIINLDVDVGKLPNHLKSYVLYLFSSDQFSVYFIILQSSTD